jgi:hypothetical protein
MKLTNVRATVAKAMTIGLLAGAFALVAPVKAQAQAFAFGVEVGHPGYDVYRHDRFDHIRAEEFRRHEEFVRRQEWERGRDFGGYHHGSPYRFR